MRGDGGRKQVTTGRGMLGVGEVKRAGGVNVRTAYTLCMIIILRRKRVF